MQYFHSSKSYMLLCSNRHFIYLNDISKGSLSYSLLCEEFIFFYLLF